MRVQNEQLAARLFTVEQRNSEMARDHAQSALACSQPLSLHQLGISMTISLDISQLGISLIISLIISQPLDIKQPHHRCLRRQRLAVAGHRGRHLQPYVRGGCNRM